MLLDYLDKRIIELEKEADEINWETELTYYAWPLNIEADKLRDEANELRKMRDMLVTEYVPIWKRELTP